MVWKVILPWQPASKNSVRGGKSEGALFKDWLEIVVYRTVPVTLSSGPFAGKAAGTAFKIQVVEVIEPGLCSFLTPHPSAHG